jgi:diguanylate cyclase (GGDEF)-like protein
LLLTERNHTELAAEAIRRGEVYGCAAGPFHAEHLLSMLTGAARHALRERPLTRLMERWARLRKRSRRHLVEQGRLLRQLAESLRHSQRELQEENHSLRRQILDLERLALTDPLTGLPNRRAIDEFARLELKRHARYRSPLAIGYADIDHFKRINSDFHHTGGDEVLKSLARILTSCVREVDSVARIGGEEFLTLARETDREGAAILAERIRSTVEEATILHNGKPIHITVSLGFAVAEVGVPAEQSQMMELAAAALSEAKRTGRNRAVIRTVGHDQVGRMTSVSRGCAL